MTPTHILFVLSTTMAISASAARKETRKAPAPAAPPPSSSAKPGGHEATFQRLLLIEDQRLPKDSFLLNSIRSATPAIARQALIVLGRIGDPAGLEDIKRLLDSKRTPKEVKRAAAFALGLMTDPTGVRMAAQNVPMQKDPDIIADLLLSVGRGGNEKNLDTLANAIRETRQTADTPTIKSDTDPKILDAAAHALGILWGVGSEKWPVPPGVLPRLGKLVQRQGAVALSASFALARFRGDPQLLPMEDILIAATKTKSDEMRALLCRAAGKLKSPATSRFLSYELGHETHIGTKIEAIKGLAIQVPDEDVIATLKKTLATPSPTLQVQTLETIAAHGAAGTPLIEAVSSLFLTSPSNWVKGSALKCLVRISPVIGRQRVTEILAIPNSPLLSYAVSSLGILATPEDIEKIATYVNHDDIRVAEEAIEALAPMSEDKFSEPLKAALRKALERADTALTSLAAQLVEKHRWKEFATPIATVYPLFTVNDQVEAKIALLNALAAVGDHSHAPLIQEALKDSERLVVVAAVGALKAITGKDESAKIPLNSRIVAPAPSYQEAMEATRKKVVLETTKGEIHLKLLEDTPLTALNFIRLVKPGALKKGFYDGKTFHRVVPNFVVQGGDPRADGYGGPGYLIRDEVSNRIHDRGTVGIATAGKDTGGCQFFFNLAPNLHLDGKYTLFAEVTKGLEVAEKLEAGDRILTAKIR